MAKAGVVLFPVKPDITNARIFSKFRWAIFTPIHMKKFVTGNRYHWTESWPVLFLIICAVSFPLFFDIFRKVAFKTAPGDDYAPFLLLLVNHQGHWPESPFGYRVLSVVLAVPLYWFLPLYKFSLLPATSTTYLRATEALSALSFLATAIAATVAFKMVRTRLSRGLGEAWLAAMLTIVLASFDGIEGIDPVGLCFVYVLLYVFEQPFAFSVLLLLMPFTNEKVMFVFFFLVAGRLILVKSFLRTHRWQIAALFASFAIYGLALKLIALPGNEGQLTLARRLPLLIMGSRASISSLKGMVRDILPALVIGLPCFIFAARGKANVLMKACDLVVPLGMFFIGLTLTDPVHFQVGRIVAYAMPLTVIAAISLIGDLDENRGEGRIAIAFDSARDRSTRIRTPLQATAADRTR